MARDLLGVIPHFDVNRQVFRQLFQAGDAHIDHQLSIAVKRIKLWRELNIAEVQGRFIQQPDGTEDAAHPPHILIFQPGARAPAHHHDAKTVLARLKRGAEIKGCGQAAVLGVTDPFTVAPQVKS